MPFAFSPHSREILEDGVPRDIVASVARLAQIPARELPGLPPSTAAIALASKLVLELVVRERIVPYLRAGDGSDSAASSARWGVALSGVDAERALRLAQSMPLSAFAATPEDVVDPDVEAQHALQMFLDTAADALVRGTSSRDARATPLTGSSWEARFVRALGSPNASFTTTNFAERTVEEELTRWTDRVRGARDRLRPAFRLELPGPTSDAFALQLFVQSPDDPSLLVAAEDVWAGRRSQLSTLGRAFADPAKAEEALLGGLGAAANVFAPLRAALDERAPSRIVLDAHAAWAFLSEAAPVLGESGFGVIVPGELTGRGERRLRLRMRVGEDKPGRAAPKVAGKVEGAGGLAFEQIADFQWEAAIGNETLSHRELAALAAQKAPLVRHRGVWVAVDPREIEEIKKRVTGAAGRVRMTDALRMALAGETRIADRVVAVEARGLVAATLDRIRGAAAIEEAPPAALHATLRPYQARGLGWLRTMADLGLGGCLADDMGLGKTVQLLAFLLDRAERSPTDPRASILVAPTSVLGNWEREIARFAPSITVIPHYGGGREKDAAALAAMVANTKKPALVLTSYGVARRDAAILAKVDWSTAVLDEAQNIKNAASATAKAVRALPATHRFALTGTPVENRLAELWSVLDFANPGLLGGVEAFRTEFAVPVERYGNEEAAQKLRRIVAPFLLRRLKSDPNVIRDLPAKNEMEVVCTLTREQASLYKATVDEELKEIGGSKGIERRGRVLALIGHLKQICNHPAQFLGERGPLPRRSGKLARVTAMLDEAMQAGDKALVFTQYREMGDHLVSHLASSLGVEVAFLHGGTSKRARDELVQRFQSEEVAPGERAPRIFVLSLKAGGTGLNLTAASHVFHYDRWWNPAVEDQATDRAYRIGQKRAVQVHKLLCKGTVEDRIAVMLSKKRDLASKVVGSGERWITELGDDDLRELVTLSKDAVLGDEVES